MNELCHAIFRIDEEDREEEGCRRRKVDRVEGWRMMSKEKGKRSWIQQWLLSVGRESRWFVLFRALFSRRREECKNRNFFSRLLQPVWDELLGPAWMAKESWRWKREKEARNLYFMWDEVHLSQLVQETWLNTINIPTRDEVYSRADFIPFHPLSHPCIGTLYEWSLCPSLTAYWWTDDPTSDLKKCLPSTREWSVECLSPHALLLFFI